VFCDSPHTSVLGYSPSVRGGMSCIRRDMSVCERVDYRRTLNFDTDHTPYWNSGVAWDQSYRVNWVETNVRETQLLQEEDNIVSHGNTCTLDCGPHVNTTCTYMYACTLGTHNHPYQEWVEHTQVHSLQRLGLYHLRDKQHTVDITIHMYKLTPAGSYGWTTLWFLL